MPETVALSFARPHGYEQLSTSEFATLVLARVRDVEAVAGEERRRTGARVMGRKAILSQRYTDRPGTREPRRDLSPRVAARSKWSRIEALLRNKAFREAYFEARARFIQGLRDVVFPSGTYWLRRFARACCASCPAPI